MFKQILIISSLLIFEILTKPSPLTTYDQRQNGKYNIHFNIKDVQIISLEGDNLPGVGDDTVYDYGDYDYDPDHLTINPIFGVLGSKPTQKPQPAIVVPPPAQSTASEITPATEPSTISTTTAPTTTPESTTTTTTTTTTTPIPSTTSNVIEVTTIKNKTHSVEVVEVDEVVIGHGPSISYLERPVENNSNSQKPQSKPLQQQQQQPAVIDYEEIPVEVIVEPVLKPKYRLNRKPVPGKYIRKPALEIIRNDEMNPKHVDNLNFNNQRYQLRNVEQVKCRRGEFRDQQGRCRYRRSGTGFRSQLINLLTALKKNGE